MATDEQKDFAAAVERLLNAYNTGDINAITEFEYGSKGFGYRTLPVRDSGNITKDQFYQISKAFSNSVNNYKVIFESSYSEVIGNVGIVGGFLTEKFATKSGQQMEVKIRSTSTYLKSDDGWRLIQRHQDIQQFKDPKQELGDLLKKTQ